MKLDIDYEQWILSDMKRKVLNIMNKLLNEQEYTKHEAVYQLVEVVNLIEIKEELERLKKVEQDYTLLEREREVINRDLEKL